MHKEQLFGGYTHSEGPQQAGTVSRVPAQAEQGRVLLTVTHRQRHRERVSLRTVPSLL